MTKLINESLIHYQSLRTRQGRANTEEVHSHSTFRSLSTPRSGGRIVFVGVIVMVIVIVNLRIFIFYSIILSTVSR